MKKFFAFACALFLSVSAFASRAVVPTDADLASYATGTYTMCIWAEACNDIVLTGTYNSWSNSISNCLKFQPVEGFDGWYVVSWNDASTDVQTKPVQLAGDGSFNWDYQLAPMSKGTTLVRGTATLEASNSGTEVYIKTIGAGIVVLALDGGWKNNPCTIVYRNYTFTLVSPDCNDSDYIVPAISGSFNSWAQEAMTMDEVATVARQSQNLPGAVFTYSARAAEGAEYKFRSSADWGTYWTNQIMEYNATEGSWACVNSGANYVLGTQTALSYDFGDPTKYRWESCVFGPFFVATHAEHGSVTGGGDYTLGHVVQLQAFPESGYHFVQWNDGNTDNPRTIKVTQDSTFAAIFAPYQYTLNFDANGGVVAQSSMTLNYGEQIGTLPVTLCAYSNFTFDGWYTQKVGGIQLMDTTAFFYPMTQSSISTLTGKELQPWMPMGERLVQPQ